jgi:hypothetical protein
MHGFEYVQHPFMAEWISVGDDAELDRAIDGSYLLPSVKLNFKCIFTSTNAPAI